MNKDLIKQIIKCKFHAANAIMSYLPSYISDEMKEFGKIIVESIDESLNVENKSTVRKTRPGGKLDEITIE